MRTVTVAESAALALVRVAVVVTIAPVVAPRRTDVISVAVAEFLATTVDEKSTAVESVAVAPLFAVTTALKAWPNGVAINTALGCALAKAPKRIEVDIAACALFCAAAIAASVIEVASAAVALLFALTIAANAAAEAELVTLA